MIDFNISEIFSTIGVGLATCILLAYFYFLFCKLFYVSLYNKDAFVSWFKANLNRDYSKSGYSIAVSILIYGLGVLMLGITDYMTDSDDSTNPIISVVQNTDLLPKETDIRKRCLIKNDSSLTGLGRDVFATPELAMPFSFAGIQNTSPSYFSQIWYQHGKEISRNPEKNKQLKNAINGIYYQAKNWCYLHSDPARNELSFIQHHIDFTRSITIISAFAFLFILILIICYTVRENLKGKKKFLVIIDGQTKRMVFYPRLSLVVLIPIILIGRECFYAAEKNFDQRAFGYYSSHLKFERGKKAIERPDLIKREPIDLRDSVNTTLILNASTD